MGLVAIGLVTCAIATACSTHGTSTPGARTNSAPPSSAPRATEPGLTVSELLADYTQTLNAGPTRFTLLRIGGYPHLDLLDGVDDRAHDAAEFVEYIGLGEGLDLHVGGANYLCTAGGDVIHSPARPHCDQLHRWIEINNGDFDIMDGLATKLPRLPTTAGPGIVSARIGAASIRGTPTTGYSVDLAAPASTGTTGALATYHFAFWIDANHLVREFQLILRTTIPIQSPASTNRPDELDDVGPPDPSVAADRLLLEQSAPGGLPSESALPPGELESTTTAQFWDIGTAPPITAPPPSAVLVPPSAGTSSPSTSEPPKPPIS
jgi:hypothetical protein